MSKLKFNKKFLADNDGFDMARPVCDALSAVPGVIKVSSFYHESEVGMTVIINFCLDDTDENFQKGLFFVSRCLCRRYWEYGNDWDLKISHGDVARKDSGEEILPIFYFIGNREVMPREEVKTHLDSMLDSMNHYLNHENFLNGFGLNTDMFDTLETRNVLTEKGA